MKTIAIIDLGSNSVRMNIVKINADATSEVLLQSKKMVRLSENMGDNMQLKEVPMHRTIEALAEFREIIDQNYADEIFAIATAAVRKAVNKEIFLNRVKSATGIDIDVISGDKEAIYDFLGVISKLELENFVIIDIGGGSTEIIAVKNRTINGKISIPIGAVGISEKFFSGGEDEEKVREARSFVDKEIEKVPFLKSAEGLPVVGLGGSNRTIAKIDTKNSDGDQFLHGCEVSKERVNEICKMIASQNLEERKLIKGVGKGRADIIIGGMLPILSIMDKIKSPSLIVSDSGVRDGMLFEKTGEMFLNILKSCE